MLKIVVGVWIFLFLNISYAHDAIDWRPEPLPKLLQEASITGKRIFFVVKAKWCGNSRHFLNDTLSNPTVIRFINNTFLPKLIDEEDNKELAQLYRVFVFPGILVLNADGKEIDRTRPFQGQALIRALNKIRRTEKTIYELEDLLIRTPNSYKLKKSLFYKSARQIDIQRALIYKIKLSVDHPKKYEMIKEDMLFELATARSFNGENAEAIKLYSEILALPKSDRVRAYHSMSVEHFIMKDFINGFKILRDAMQAIPNEHSFYFQFMLSAERFNLNIPEAIALGVAATATNSGTNENRANLFYALASLYKSAKQICDALDAISRAINLMPKEAYYLDYKLKLLDDPNSRLCQ